jgi:HAD superfamily hydrolase (TIGR01490 family)
MTLALFDLDNTLLSCDSDYEWGSFLVRKNLVDGEVYERENLRFYEQYKQGRLDIYKFSAFSFQPLAEHSMEFLHTLHDEFMDTVIRPHMGDAARFLVEGHRLQGHTLMVITATNSFITRPIVQAFGIDHLLATEPMTAAGRYTTKIEGIPCFQEGKVQRLNLWLKQNNQNLDGSFFYSDSANDLPLLELVDHPVAVDPDDKLARIAGKKAWKIISLNS